MSHAQFILVRETTDMVLRRLEGLPPSARTEQLRASVQDCMQEAEMWSAGLPRGRELELLAKRLFILHVETTKLERDTFLARSAAATA